MPRTHVHRVHVEFGDCDPAGITHFPNVFRWFDASANHFFRACGLPPWRELEKTHGILGTPLVSTSCQFNAPSTYGEDLEVHTRIEEWRDRSFVMKHDLRRGATLLAACTEIRVFAVRDSAEPSRLKAVPAPAEIRASCQ